MVEDHMMIIIKSAVRLVIKQQANGMVGKQLSSASTAAIISNHQLSSASKATYLGLYLHHRSGTF
jgi:hypothetical protein